MLVQPKQWVKYLKVKIRWKKMKILIFLSIQSIHESLWPDGKWASSKDSNPQTSDPQSSSDLLQLAQQTLEDFFPDTLKWIIGDKEYKDGIQQLVDGFQHPIINRHLVYHLLDSLLGLIFPDLPDLIQNRTNINIWSFLFIFFFLISFATKFFFWNFFFDSILLFSTKFFLQISSLS